MVTSVPAVSDLAVSASTRAGTRAAADTSVAPGLHSSSRRREPEAVGGQQRDRGALDLDPDTGEHREHVVAAGRGDGLGDRVRRTASLRTVPVACGHVRQGRVLLDRHRLEAEPGRAAGQRRPWCRRWSSRPACSAGCGRCRRAAGRRPAPCPRPATGPAACAGRGLVVERGQLRPSPPSTVSISRPARTGTLGRTGRLRAVQATASASTSRSTRNFTGVPPGCDRRVQQRSSGVCILPRASGCGRGSHRLVVVRRGRCGRGQVVPRSGRRRCSRRFGSGRAQ